MSTQKAIFIAILSINLTLILQGCFPKPPQARKMNTFELCNQGVSSHYGYGLKVTADILEKEKKGLFSAGLIMDYEYKGNLMKVDGQHAVEMFRIYNQCLKEQKELKSQQSNEDSINIGNIGSNNTSGGNLDVKVNINN